MSDRTDQPESQPAEKRGAAAYKAEREGIDQRNAAAED
jgi:hypothetical protein